jgi:hypothetical protein
VRCRYPIHIHDAWHGEPHQEFSKKNRKKHIWKEGRSQKWSKAGRRAHSSLPGLPPDMAHKRMVLTSQMVTCGPAVRRQGGAGAKEGDPLPPGPSNRARLALMSSARSSQKGQRGASGAATGSSSFGLSAACSGGAEAARGPAAASALMGRRDHTQGSQVPLAGSLPLPAPLTHKPKPRAQPTGKDQHLHTAMASEQPPQISKIVARERGRRGGGMGGSEASRPQVSMVHLQKKTACLPFVFLFWVCRLVSCLSFSMGRLPPGPPQFSEAMSVTFCCGR